MMNEDHCASYASAGVDIEAGDRAVELIKPRALKATRPEVRGGLGGFAGLFALGGAYREPLLASSTDGVGTKLTIAQAMDKHDTPGLDLVARDFRLERSESCGGLLPCKAFLDFGSDGAAGRRTPRVSSVALKSLWNTVVRTQYVSQIDPRSDLSHVTEFRRQSTQRQGDWRASARGL
jgi:hypothetical protein